jgi:hypothetical protein
VREKLSAGETYQVSKDSLSNISLLIPSAVCSHSSILAAPAEIPWSSHSDKVQSQVSSTLTVDKQIDELLLGCNLIPELLLSA